MQPVRSVVLALALGCPASAIRSQYRGSQNRTDCEELKSLTIGGKDVGDAAILVCKHWPEKYGKFPITDINEARTILEHGGGLWDKMKEVAETRKSANFCWRDQTLRELASCDESMSGSGRDYKGCQWKTHTGEPCINWQVSDYPWVGDHSFCRNPDRARGIWCYTQKGFADCDPVGQERVTTTTTTPCIAERTSYKPLNMPGQLRSTEGSLSSCQTRCSLVSGCEHFSYWPRDGGCHLQDSSSHKAGAWSSVLSGPPSCETASVASAASSLQEMNSSSELMATSQGCQVFVNGQCYGGCPSGFQTSLLLQFFAPVCSSTCKGSRLPVSCGLGCAGSARDCVSTVQSQMLEAINAVGQATTFLTGNQVVSKVVETVSKLVEFIVTTLWTLVRNAKELWSQFKERESMAAFLTIFVDFIQDESKRLGQDLMTVKAIYGKLAGFWTEMVTEGFKFRSAPLKLISNAIKDSGEQMADLASGLVDAFAYPKCT